MLQNHRGNKKGTDPEEESEMITMTNHTNMECAANSELYSLKSPSYGRTEGREERKSPRDTFILKILRQHKNEWQYVNLDGKKLYKVIWEEI